MEESEASLDHGELDHCEEVGGEFFESCGDPPATLKPADAAFDAVALAVASTIELGRPASLTAMCLAFLRDHGAQAVLPAPVTDTRDVVRLVPGHGVGPAAATDRDAIEQRLEPCGFVSLTGTDARGQRDALGVGYQMKLRTPTPS